MFDNILFLITARGGSKGIPGKNIKPLNGKPLLYYSIDAAREVADDIHICLSTDSPQIMQVAEEYGLHVPFTRPAELAGDSSGSYEVILHAIQFYEAAGKQFDTVVLLQATSPFRNGIHIREAIALYSPEIDMVVSVKQSEANPYYTLYEDDAEKKYIHLSKESNFVRRQDAPGAYVFNGAVYVINIHSIKKSPLSKFQKIVKYEMDAIASVDLDTMLDWQWAEFLLEKKLV